MFNADGTFTYAPAANWFGVDAFTYKANDGQDDSNAAAVTITVNSVNDAPTLAPASFTLTHDLGKIPEIFLWSLDQEGWIYATPSQRDAWTIQTITLTSSVAPASIALLVL